MENSPPTNRKWKVHLPLAVLCGAVAFVVLAFSGWYNFGDMENFYPRQSWTRSQLRRVSQSIHEFQTKEGHFPRRLDDIPVVRKESSSSFPLTIDPWGNPLQYDVVGTSYELYSFGRDGRPGGIGLDADLYDDNRNGQQSLATFWQYFTELDSEEVDHGRLFIGGFIAAMMVAAMVFEFVDDFDDRPKRPKHLLATIGFAAIIAIIATAVASVILMLHIPSGH